MKKLLEYLPFQFLLFLIFGILCEFRSQIWTNELLFLLVPLIIVMIKARSRIIYSLCTLIFFFGLGMYTVYSNDDRNQEDYFFNFYKEDSSSILRIKEILKPNRYSIRYYTEVVQVDSLKTKGRVLLSIPSDSSSSFLSVGDQIVISEKFTEIKSPLNPHQFNYKQYLGNQGVYLQVRLKRDQFVKLGPHHTFYTRIVRFRKKIKDSLAKEGFAKDELGVINALLLGQRSEVSKELLDNYSKAGAIHILAISGLHVGIILLILSWLLKPLELIKNGKYFKLLLIVIVLWLFALLAGMSASVVRAVTMFSAVALGQFFGRRNTILYSLVLSMFVLLICSPRFLFDVGFQLSYLAVFGIVVIQPKIVALLKFNWMILDKIWQLTTVSLSAQLAVLPLSLYYFHQFPGLFLVSNLVIVPFLGMILIGGILIIVLSMMSYLPQFLVDLYGFIISTMNDFVSYVSKQEAFLFSDISFTGLMLISCYLLIIRSYFFLKHRNGRNLVFFLIAILLVQSTVFFEGLKSHQKEEFVLFHKTKQSVHGIRQNGKLIANNMNDAAEKSYAIGEKIVLDQTVLSTSYLNFSGTRVLFIDSLGVYPLTGEIDIVILQYSPKINLERMIKQLNPKQIVKDGSNYKTMSMQWEKTCLKTKIPFWNTSQNGAYILGE